MAKSFIDNNTKAFKEELFCDCTIFVSTSNQNDDYAEGNRFKDEKMIIENLGESQKSQIFIRDFKPHVVLAMLQFLYSCGTSTPGDADGKTSTPPDADGKSSTSTENV
uniref:Uncharacterized protein n=1 Tax=Romanomermis culicivorax TaxID=13658 RepID=A0A915IVE3_ROMCU